MLERSISNRILTLRLSHGKANALDGDLLEALRAQLAGATASLATDTPAPDRPVAVILAGTGTIFSAGVDLLRLSSAGPDYIRRFFPLLSEVLLQLFTIELPVVAALNGHAVAGGCLLAFACDYRLMAEGGHRIGLPELSVGLPFPAVGHEIVRFAVPGHRIQSLMYTGATLLPGEALAAGFLDEVVSPESLEARAQAVATQLGGMQPDAFRHTKRFLRSDAVDRLARRGRAADAEALRLWLSAEAQERVRLYLARVLGK
jgi:enoyl-CoA hydratase